MRRDERQDPAFDSNLVKLWFWRLLDAQRFPTPESCAEMPEHERLRRDAPGAYSRVGIEPDSSAAGTGLDGYRFLDPGPQRDIPPDAARTIAALLILRDQVIASIIAGVRSPRLGGDPVTWTPPRHHDNPTSGGIDNTLSIGISQVSSPSARIAGILSARSPRWASHDPSLARNSAISLIIASGTRW